KIVFVGNTVLSNEELAQAILVRPGHLIDEDAIAKDVIRIQSAYQKKGYMCNVSQAAVDRYGVLTFVINEMRIEGYEVEGLKRTKRWIVDKQIDIKPGELYSDKLVREQVMKLRALGLFEEVRIEPLPGRLDPDNSIIIVFRVKEARTGQIALQLGYSSLDNFVLSLGVSESNFRGRAERIQTVFEFFGRTSYEFSFFEPYLLKGDTSVELSLFDTERRRQFVGGTLVSTESDRFDERRRGGYVRATRPITKATRLSLGFRSERVFSAYFQGTREVVPPSVERPVGAAALWGRDADSGASNSADFNLSTGPGERPGVPIVAAPLHPGGRLSSFTLDLAQDFRDSPADPTKGHYRRLSLEIAGSFLGGDQNFRKLVGEYRYFYPISSKQVIAARLMAGTSFGNLPLFESFSVGGANTLRGYEEDRYRGEEFLLLNLEYRRRISDKFTAIGFLDVGDAYGGTFRTVIPGFNIDAEDQEFSPHVGVGVGARFQTPVGPLRLDIGFGEEGSRAHFSFGHTF
ncbi:MAG: BamA/TamA family outer membrane protein, partial [Armatimonadetes bacterium]|nr:BamA/TamA family outer membrane protein [Armatimonadota bacterium]